MGRRRYDDALDILTPLDEQPEEIKPSQPLPSKLPTQSSEVDTPFSRLERAADLLLTQLPIPVRTFFHEVSEKILHISHWELLLGSVMSQYSQGNLVSPNLDPSWKNPSFVDEERECEYCHQPFHPQRPNQPFCSSKCGGLKRKEEVERKVKEDRERMAKLVLKEIERRIEEVEKEGKKPSQLYLATNIYSIIEPFLDKDRGKEKVRGLTIKVDDSGTYDRVYII